MSRAEDVALLGALLVDVDESSRGAFDTVDHDRSALMAVPAAESHGRKGLTAESTEVVLAALQVLRRTFDDGGGDFDDAIKAIPVAHRVIEHAEKLEAQQRDVGGLAVMYVTFDLSGAVTATDARTGESDVIDVATVAVPLPSPADDGGALSWEFAPADARETPDE